MNHYNKDRDNIALATEERELFRKSIIEQQMIIDDLENRLNVISGVRNELRAKLAEYERAPTFTYMYRFPHMGGFVWRHSSSDFNGARPVESIELIARPAKEST